MTQEEIIKGNKLIAEFMGFVRYFPNMTLESDLSKFYYYPYNDRIFDEGLYTSTIKMTSQEGYYVNQCIRENHHLKNMQFHSSWGWLIPVIGKIYSLNEYTKYKDYTSNIVCEGGIYINTKFIEVTFRDVVDFIKWYNKNKEINE